ncbi:MAG TPA: protein kinase [bacterium]|nr:protein kinase [bacterium]
MIGTLLRERYRVDSKLGEGGMGVVYRAHDDLLDRPVAIKTLTPALFGEEGARRLVREAQSAARLNHPNVVAIYDAVEEGGQFAIVMELVEGKTLRELLPVPVGRLVEIAVHILQGLEYAHAQGIVHRDIKPENIVVTADGSAKLMDFGLARSEGRSRLTQTGMVVGTVAYLAPEQALGGMVDGRSDLYALGAVLYEAVAGRPPFESEDPISVITQHINVPPVAPHWHNPAVPEALERIILKLLAKDPVRRYQSAREALDAVTAARASMARTAGTSSVISVGGAATEVPAAQEKLAGPELVQTLGRSPLVGRDAELTLLKGLIDRTITGQGGVVLLAGPLGVGKTRLIEEASTYARLRGVTVVSGSAYESAPPYEPFARALHDLARGVDSETLSARLGEFAPELVGLMPELERQLPKQAARAIGAPEDRKSRLFAGVAHFLGASAAANPILLALDDMHFADAATVELLQHVARRSPSYRLLLIVAYRPDEVPASASGKAFTQIVHALGREAFSSAVALRPLTSDQVTDLIEQLAKHPQRPVMFGRRIHEITEGNPYFIEEVIKGLFERGTLYIKDGSWTTDFDDVRDYSFLEVPGSVQGAVETRLRSLDEETRQALTHAAVIGRQWSFDALLAVTGADESALLDQVERAIRAQLIREVRGPVKDVYEFSQPMLRRVLYDAIPRRRRRMLHRQVGEALEQLYRRDPTPHLEALSLHFVEAEEPEKVLKYAHLAAKKAAAIFAYGEATGYMRQAISAAEDLDRPAERLALMEELADLVFVTGRKEEIIPAYEEALQYWKSLPSGSPLDGARLCRKLGEAGTRWAVYNPRTREHITEGLRLLESSPTHPERIKLIIAQAFDYYWLRPEAESDYPAAEASAREGYRLAEAIGSVEDMSAALDALGGIYNQTAEPARGLEIELQRVPLVERLDAPDERVDMHRMLYVFSEMLGDYPTAYQHLSRANDLAVRFGRVSSLFHAISDMCWMLIRWSRWDEAERWCRSYLELEEKTGVRHPRRRTVFCFRAFLAAVGGDHESAQREDNEAAQIPGGHPTLAWLTPYLRLGASLAVHDHERSRSLVEEALRLSSAPFARAYVRALALEYAAQVRDWRFVDEFGDETLAQSGQSGMRHEIGLNARSLGVHRREHGRLDEAEALFGEAERHLRDLESRWELGKTLRELALLRRAQGRGEEAASLLQEALTHFEALRAVLDVKRTRALLGG